MIECYSLNSHHNYAKNSICNINCLSIGYKTIIGQWLSSKSHNKSRVHVQNLKIEIMSPKECKSSQQVALLHSLVHSIQYVRQYKSTEQLIADV